MTDNPPELTPVEDQSGDMPDWDVLEDTSPDVVLPPTDMDVMDGEMREIGYPEEYSEYWHYQGMTNDCALYAQGEVLEADGQDFDIDKYREQGIDGGWYTPEEGTYLDGFGDLLEENGVAVNRYEDGATIQDMANEMDQGHGVVVAVDCLPIWGQPGGHALWVTGMDVGNDGVPTGIICNDSGREDGQQINYGYEDFKLAWDMYGNIMVATQEPLDCLS